MTEESKTAAKVQIQSKRPFLVSQLIIGLFLSTYVLSVALIEFSLSLYAVRENKINLIPSYLMFKKAAPLWKWWQIAVTLIVPFSVFDAIRGVVEIFTKNATKMRNFLDFVKACQLAGILYTTIACVMPLESNLIQGHSMALAEDFCFFQFFVFILNFIGWALQLLIYRESQVKEPISVDKKNK